MKNGIKIVESIVRTILSESPYGLRKGWNVVKNWKGNRDRNYEGASANGYQVFVKKFIANDGTDFLIYVYGKNKPELEWGKYFVQDKSRSYTGMVQRSINYTDVINGIESKYAAGRFG